MRIEYIGPNDEFFNINWSTGYNCNYNCSYCIQKSDKAKFRHSIDGTNKKLKSMIPNMNELIKEIHNITGKSIVLRIIGGEPSILDLDYIIDNLDKSSISSIKICTNFSMPLEYYNNLIDKYKIIHYTCSLHEEFVDPWEFIKKFSKLKLDNEHKMIQFVLTENNIITLHKLVPILAIYKPRISIDVDRKLDQNLYSRLTRYELVTKLNQIYNKTSVDNTQYKVDDEILDKARTKDLLKGYPIYAYKCNTHKYHLAINYKGLVSACVSNRHGTMLGNLNDVTTIQNIKNALSMDCITCINENGRKCNLIQQLDFIETIED